MGSDLALKIKQLIDEQNISVFGLEKKAGLKMNAVRHILSGQTKRPSAETILAISRALGCSIGQLIGDEKEEKNFLKDIEFENEELFRSIFLFSLDFFKEKNVTLSSRLLFESIQNIYVYLNESNNGEFDEKFADWVLSKKISSKTRL